MVYFASQFWVLQIIYMIAIVFFIGYTSSFMEYISYSIYLSPCMLFVMLFKIYAYLFHNVCTNMIANLFIILSTGLMEAIDEIVLEQFEEYNPLGILTDQKKGFVRVEEGDMEEER